MKLTSPSVIKEVMQKNNLKFNKNFGQNFLIDDHILDMIIEASCVDENYAVIEIGPGLGTLTQALAQKAGRVISIEIDKKIFEYLHNTFSEYNNLEFIQSDVLKLDLNKLIEEKCSGMKVAVVANLPYYITTPIIMNLLEKKLPLSNITVMVQKEVADRMCASPGSDYGAISLAVQYYSSPKIITMVPSGCFMPPPKVTSAVIKLDIENHIKPNVNNEKLLFNIIKSAFGQRRKTLVNALSGSSLLNISKEDIKNIVIDVCNNANIRGELLTLQQYIEISEKYMNLVEQ